MTNATQLKEITKDELNEKMHNKKPFLLLNVLAPEGYQMGVIKGSRKIPLAELDKRIKELDKSKDVVTYCANAQCDASHKAAELLAAKGFTVCVYKGGAQEWAAAGLPLDQPVEKSAHKEDSSSCGTKEMGSKK
jgi:ArsR family transcriptional regulator